MLCQGLKFCWSRCMCTWCCCHQWSAQGLWASDWRRIEQTLHSRRSPPETEVFLSAQGFDDKLMHEWQGLSSSTYKLCTNIFSKKHTWVFDHSSRSRLSKYVLTIKRLMDVTCMKNKNCQEFHTDYFHCGRQLLQLSKEVAKHQWFNVIVSHDKLTYVGIFWIQAPSLGAIRRSESPNASACWHEIDMHIVMWFKNLWRTWYTALWATASYSSDSIQT